MVFYKKNQLYVITGFFILFGVAAWVGAAKAEDAILSQDAIDIYTLKVDQATLSRGYTASVFTDNFKVGIFPEVLGEETEIIFKEFKNPAEILPLPDEKEKKILGSIFEFDIKNSSAFDDEKPLIIEIKYPDNSNNLKEIYFWDKGRSEWRELPSKSIVERGVVRVPLHLPYARLAIFENPNIMEVGTASWYRYQYCDCAASPDWPKGTKLKVTDLADANSVVVTVNDYGPDRSIHPGRAIDLDVVAFGKIAPKSIGLIRVKVEKL